MLQRFKIYRDPDMSYAGRIMFALDEAKLFRSIRIFPNGEIEIETDTPVCTERLMKLLSQFKDLYIICNEKN